jgi:hypothetical protein
MLLMSFNISGGENMVLATEVSSFETQYCVSNLSWLE